MKLEIKELNEDDRPWGQEIFQEHWGGDCVISKGAIHYFKDLPGFVAKIDSERVGLITYNISQREVEITSLNSLKENQGVGSALVDRVVSLAREKELDRVWLVTTNDNLHAQRFYQRRDFRLICTNLDGVAAARKIKPGIPLIGDHEIPLRDEFEFSLSL